MNEITKKLSKNKNYKLTEEEKTQVDLLDKSLTSNNRFQLYKQLYNKTYPTKTEETIASNNLKKSLIEINKVNSSDAPYKLGFTKFSDLSDEEFYTNYVGILINDEESSTISKDTLQKNIQDDGDITKSSDDVKNYLIDWDKNGKVSPIQDQGKCGSCWAFSSVATLESKIAIDKNLSQKNIPKLSEQQLVSCSKGNNKGCKGGMPINAFAWYKSNNAAFEKDYSYTSGSTTLTGTCKPEGKANKTIKVKAYKQFSSEAEMAQNLYKNGPISIGVGVANTLTGGGAAPDIKNYKSGIFTGNCGIDAAAHKPDHAVVIVGLVNAKDVSSKVKDNIKYAWKIRNSWGPTFGEKGYFYLPYGQNKCLVKAAAVGITSIDADIPKGDAKTTTPGPSPTPKPGPKPGPSPSPTPKPGPNPISSYQKYYTNPNNGACIGTKMDFKNNGVEYSVCTIAASPPPLSAGHSSYIQLGKYCPGMELKGNIAPIFFKQSLDDKKYCGVACNSNSDCFNGATCQLINPQSQLQVCAFRK